MNLVWAMGFFFGHVGAIKVCRLPIDTSRSKHMAQIPKGRLVKGPYKPICRDG